METSRKMAWIARFYWEIEQNRVETSGHVVTHHVDIWRLKARYPDSHRDYTIQIH